MFNLDRVSSVYSGRKGCACGCRGKYSYAAAHKAERPSYLDGDDGVSDRTVKTLVAKVERLLAEGTEVEGVMLDTDGEWFAVDLYHDRTYTVYFAGRQRSVPAFLDVTG